MNKNKIYFLINSLEGGGAERVITNISEKLSINNYVTIITLKDVNFYKLPENVDYIPLSKIKNNLLMFLMIPFYVFKFKKILRDNSFDNGVSFLEIANFINILANKKATISFRTNISFFKGIVGMIYKLFIKLLYPKAEKIIVNSEENKYDLANYLKISEDKINIIYNPIDLNEVEKLKTEKVSEELLEKLNGKKVFITVGRLIPEKHHRMLLNSFKKIYDDVDKDWIYLIVGPGAEKEKLIKQSYELGLNDNVVFLGAQKNVFKYLNIADYFVYASRVEGFPNVLIEAITSNLPIISSDFISGAKECILGKYDKNLKNLKYPYYGPNGVLLDLDNYEIGFLEAYKNLDKVKQEKIGFEKFMIENLDINL